MSSDANRLQIVQRRRRVWRVIAIGLLLIAAFSCMVRLSWIRIDSTSTEYTDTQLLIEHGSVTWQRSHASAMAKSPSSSIFNRQLDLGFKPKFTFGRTRDSGGKRGDDVAIPVALLLGIAGITILLLSLRRIRLPGLCRCGYALTGLKGTQCPECGAAVTPKAMTPRSNGDHPGA